MSPPAPVHERKRDLGDVLDAIQAGVLVLDPTGRVEQLNSAASRFLELSVEAVRGEPVEQLLGAAHPIAALGRGVLRTALSSQQSDVVVERRNDEDLLVDVAASPLFGDRGDPDGVLLVLRDRSLQKRLQRLESERERYASFGRIATGLAHEIKNPLGGIRGAGELLAVRGETEKSRETAELIVREATRIAALVDEFMVFARGDALRLEAVNIHAVIDGVLGLLSHDPAASGVHVERSFDPSIPPLLADPDRLTQVLLNLVGNAIQAMAPAGGALTITTRMTLEHRVTTPEGRLVPTLAVWVRDTGPGMSDEVLGQATTPFFTTRAGGTGLGLAVAEYWVSKHGGVLSLSSQTGVGTDVRVTLPMRRPRSDPMS